MKIEQFENCRLYLPGSTFCPSLLGTIGRAATCSRYTAPGAVALGNVEESSASCALRALMTLAFPPFPDRARSVHLRYTPAGDVDDCASIFLEVSSNLYLLVVVLHHTCYLL